jgi:hypothetical protein
MHTVTRQASGFPVEDALDGLRIIHPDSGADFPVRRTFRAHLTHLGEYGLLVRVRDKASVFALTVDIETKAPAAAVVDAGGGAVSLRIEDDQV